MQIKREIEVKMSASRRYIIRQLSPENSLSPCPECGEPMVAAELAANVLGMNQRRIFQAIETGLVHFREAEAGSTLICIASITTDSDENSADTK